MVDVSTSPVILDNASASCLRPPTPVATPASVMADVAFDAMLGNHLAMAFSPYLLSNLDFNALVIDVSANFPAVFPAPVHPAIAMLMA